MGRLTCDARSRAEQNIRAAMDRLLRGDIPPGGRCDITTLAAQAGFSELKRSSISWPRVFSDECAARISRPCLEARAG
jgi:hypothetical protein